MALLRALVARRELVAVGLLLLALALGLGLRPALRVVAPGVAVDVAWRQRGADPWGRAWIGPLPLAPWESPRSVDGSYYSAGPDGVDESVYFDYAERLGATPQNWASHELVFDPRPDGQFVRVGLAGRLHVVYTEPWHVEMSAHYRGPRTAKRPSEEVRERLQRDLLARTTLGPRGDDLFVAGREAWWIRLLADQPVERWLGQGLFALAWLVGARPRAARDRRLAVEAWRVLLLASLPGAALAWAARRALPPAGPTLLVPAEVAACTSSAGVALIGATWLRLRRHAPDS